MGLSRLRFRAADAGDDRKREDHEERNRIIGRRHEREGRERRVPKARGGRERNERKGREGKNNREAVGESCEEVGPAIGVDAVAQKLVGKLAR